MIYDCFPFFNELDILKLRMEIMDPFVDKFVIEEAAYTFPASRNHCIFTRIGKCLKNGMIRLFMS